MDFSKVLEKFIKGGVKAAILALGTILAALKIDTTGVDFELLTTCLTALAAAIVGGLFEAIRNALKMRFGIKWL